MWVIRVVYPFGVENFGGDVGKVDWGKQGENAIEINSESRVAKSIKTRPDLYRVINLISIDIPEEVEEIIAPETIDEESTGLEGMDYNDLRRMAKEMGIEAGRPKKDELIALIEEKQLELESGE